MDHESQQALRARADAAQAELLQLCEALYPQLWRLEQLIAESPPQKPYRSALYFADQLRVSLAKIQAIPPRKPRR